MKIKKQQNLILQHLEWTFDAFNIFAKYNSITPAEQANN